MHVKRMKRMLLKSHACGRGEVVLTIPTAIFPEPLPKFEPPGDWDGENAASLFYDDKGELDRVLDFESDPELWKAYNAVRVWKRRNLYGISEVEDDSRPIWARPDYLHENDPVLWPLNEAALRNTTSVWVHKWGSPLVVSFTGKSYEVGRLAGCLARFVNAAAKRGCHVKVEKAERIC